jgi:hypothetical protein
MSEGAKRKIAPETREADRRDARAEHDADREPTADEDKAAPARDELDPEVSENYREATERGANTRGEGRIDP